MIDLNEFITITPDVRGGKPCIKGTRITVYDILEYIACGMSETEILADFPSLKPEHLRAVSSGSHAPAVGFAAMECRARHSHAGASKLLT
jgi:uncharacterized protein (DUF433 family)